MNKMHKCIFVLVAFTLLNLPWLCNAQPDESGIDELEEIVVTATRDRKLLDTPASISLITAKELEEQGITNVGEAIVKVPGVYDDGAATYYLSVRGTRSSSSGGPLVLIDGVPQNVGMYGYNYLETIPVSDIEHIEILRSPGSSVFGADSARGVINIVTKKAKKDQPVMLKAKASYGSWHTLKDYATLSGSVDEWDFSLLGSHLTTDGYTNDNRRQYATRVKTGYNFSNQSRLGFDFGYTDTAFDTVRGKNKYALENDRREADFYEEPGSEKTMHNETDQNLMTYALDFTYENKALFLNSLAAATTVAQDVSYKHQMYTSPNSVYDDDRDQTRYKFDLSGGYHFSRGFFQYTPILGVNLETTDLKQRRDYYNDPIGKTTSKRKADIDYDHYKLGLFFQNNFLFGDHWELNSGIRRDRVKYDAENQNNNSVDTKLTEYSWSVAPGYHWNERATTFASVGKSYWFPTPYYYTASMEKMNPENLPDDLKPEESLVYELGHKQSLAKWANINITLFWMDYKDKFAIFYDSTQTYAGYKNTGDAEQKGVELEVDGRVSRWFGYRLSGTYMKAEWTSGTERVYTWETPTSRDFRNLDGNDLNRVPDYKYVVGLDFFPMDNLKFNIDVNGTGPYWVDYLNRIEYEKKTTIDMGIRYELNKWSLWALGKNILDEEIESVYNSSGKLNSSADEIARNGLYDNLYYPKNGRYFEVGLTYHF